MPKEMKVEKNNVCFMHSIDFVADYMAGNEV